MFRFLKRLILYYIAFRLALLVFGYFFYNTNNSTLLSPFDTARDIQQNLLKKVAPKVMEIHKERIKQSGMPVSPEIEKLMDKNFERLKNKTEQ